MARKRKTKKDEDEGALSPRTVLVALLIAAIAAGAAHLSLQFLQCRPLLPCREKLFFCCLETFPPNFQPFLITLVMDISEGVSDGQHFPALYFFCKVYICPLFSLKSSRTIISTDS